MQIESKNFKYLGSTVSILVMEDRGVPGRMQGRAGSYEQQPKPMRTKQLKLNCSDGRVVRAGPPGGGSKGDKGGPGVQNCQV